MNTHPMHELVPDSEDSYSPHGDHVQFVEDMLAADLEPRWYQGRSWWKGPAVLVDDIADAMSVTRVRCQWDNMGRSYVVYPQAK